MKREFSALDELHVEYSDVLLTLDPKLAKAYKKSIDINERKSKAKYLDVLSKGSLGKAEEKEKEKEEHESKEEKNDFVDAEVDKNRRSHGNTNTNKNENENDSNAFKRSDHDRNRQKVVNAKPISSLERSWVDKNDVLRSEEKSKKGSHIGTDRESEREGEREGDNYWQKQGTWEKGAKYVPTQNKVRYEETQNKQRQIDKQKQKQMEEDKQARNDDKIINVQRSLVVDRTFRDDDDDDDDHHSSSPMKSKEPELNWNRSVFSIKDLSDHKALVSVFLIFFIL